MLNLRPLVVILVLVAVLAGPSLAVAAPEGTLTFAMQWDPKSPWADRHAALGFSEVGRAAIHDGSKTVRYLRRTL